MSKGRRVGDIERTVTILDLLHRRYANGNAMSRSHVVIEQVAPGVGFSAAQRWADVLVLGVWPSKGLTLHGYEVKASKADLKRELADLSKHQALARYCDSWTLVAWDDTVLVEGIPDHWGVEVTEGDDEDRCLKIVRKAAALTPEPWSRTFVCSLIRNAYEQSPNAAFVARACADASLRGLHDGRHYGEMELERLLKPLKRHLYGENEWKWPDEAFHDTEAVLAAILAKLQQGVLALAQPPEEGQ